MTFGAFSFIIKIYVKVIEPFCFIEQPAVAAPQERRVIMRVITGSARGRNLTAPDGLDTRPTSDMTKGAVFSILQMMIENSEFLDLFAGSGQMGIEAISRGAENAVFVDLNNDAISVIKGNLSKTGFTDKARVIKGEYTSLLASTNDRFDIAFLDPPYHIGILEKALGLVTNVMSEHGIIVCEHPTDVKVPEMIGDFALERQRKYSKIIISIYRKV